MRAQTSVEMTLSEKLLEMNILFVMPFNTNIKIVRNIKH